MGDTNWFSVVRENAPDLSGFSNPPDPSAYQDTLKFSVCTNVEVRDLTIEGGTENCVDAVRGGDYTIAHCRLNCHGDAAVVFKGAIEGWAIVNCIIEPHGPTDVECGQFDNYWYPFRAPTSHGLVQGTRTTNGAAVRVTCWNADKPEVDKNVVVTKMPWAIWFPYFLWRYFAVRISGQVPWKFKYDPPQTPTRNGIPQ
jgi:hypothetical protein